MSTDNTNKYHRFTHIVAIVMMLIAAVLRIYVYMQNRNLILDEANIARNINERGFSGLIHPLDYEQYAPPLFLWITKLNTLIFNISEYALRLYPLLCGLAAIWVLYKVLRELMPIEGIWFPLSLFGFSAIMIRYSSEVKQYMPDVLITLLLVQLAFKINVRQTPLKKFLLYWIVAGSVAIWASMPSVFVLTGVAGYYFLQYLEARKRSVFLVLVIIGVVWLGQFALYYFSVLKEQANSDYLQNFHKKHFLFATPSNQAEWNHNLYAFNSIVYKFTGMYKYVYETWKWLMILGFVSLIFSNIKKAALLILPILFLGLAASIEQYSVLPRVVLFSMPLLIIIMSYGFSHMLKFRYRLPKLILLVAALFVVVSDIGQTIEEIPFKYEELTEGMTFLQESGLKSEAISVYHSSVPAFIYYTSIHPDSSRWNDLKNADRLYWHTSYDSLGWFMRNVWKSRVPLGFLYTNFTDVEFEKRNDAIDKHLDLVGGLDKPYVKAYVYIKPEEED